MTLRTIGAACVALGVLPACTQAPPPNEPVSVTGGRVRGIVMDEVRSFRGIPYAAPPVGDLRWRPPQPVVAWEGERDGTAYGSECPQTQYPDGSVYIRPLQPQSEDCLFVNVWTPVGVEEPLPVLVWVHGGALTRGSGTSDVRSGIPLASKGIVVVSFNYRLGVLGYFAHPELSAESPQRASGNYGLLDQMAALQWVQQNIAAFGGDPARVTIAGESAGSWSVNALVASPLAKGLFVGAIGQSGGRFGPGLFLHDQGNGQPSAEALGIEFTEALVGSTPEVALPVLRSAPIDALLRTRFRTQEVVDGWALPSEIRTIFAERRHNNVPVILGSTADEATSLVSETYVPRTRAEYEQRIAAQYGGQAAAFERAYGVESDADIRRAMLGAYRDTVFSLPMRTWARLATAAGARAYLYLFSHVPPSPRRDELGAFHASEIPYVFDVLTAGDPREAGFAYERVDHDLADAMSSYWVNFVKTGNPNGNQMLEWPAYNINTEPYMSFGNELTVGQHLFKQELDFQESFAAQAGRP